MKLVLHDQAIGAAGALQGVSRAWISVSELAALVERGDARARRCLALWLAPAERATLAGLEVPKRRREWLAGRIAAKEVARRRHGLAGDDALRRIEIAAAQAGPSQGKPCYRLDGAPGPFDLSISHSGDHAAAALGSAPGERVGIDLEQIEARGAGFEALALSERERAAVAGLTGEARALAVTQRWVLKEALGKALGAGLRLRFERITVHLEGRPDAPAIRFDAPREHEPLLPAGIGAMLGRVGALCVASVAIRPAAPP